MRKLFGVAILTAASLAVAGVAQAQDDRPHWAYHPVGAESTAPAG